MFTPELFEHPSAKTVHADTKQISDSLFIRASPALEDRPDKRHFPTAR